VVGTRDRAERAPRKKPIIGEDARGRSARRVQGTGGQAGCEAQPGEERVLGGRGRSPEIRDAGGTTPSAPKKKKARERLPHVRQGRNVGTNLQMAVAQNMARASGGGLNH